MDFAGCYRMEEYRVAAVEGGREQSSGGAEERIGVVARF